jgi:hypothetical protein
MRRNHADSMRNTGVIEARDFARFSSIFLRLKFFRSDGFAVPAQVT